MRHLDLFGAIAHFVLALSIIAFAIGVARTNDLNAFGYVLVVMITAYCALTSLRCALIDLRDWRKGKE